MTESQLLPRHLFKIKFRPTVNTYEVKKKMNCSKFDHSLQVSATPPGDHHTLPTAFQKSTTPSWWSTMPTHWQSTTSSQSTTPT